MLSSENWSTTNYINIQDGLNSCLCQPNSLNGKLKWNHMCLQWKGVYNQSELYQRKQNIYKYRSVAPNYLAHGFDCKIYTYSRPSEKDFTYISTEVL